MELKATAQFMTDALTPLLEEGETLRFPFYGTLEEKTVSQHGYFGLAGNTLLVVIPTLTDAGKVAWAARIPLDVESCAVKKSVVPHQHRVQLKLRGGSKLRLRVSKKLMGNDFPDQEEHVTEFLEYLARYA